MKILAFAGLALVAGAALGQAGGMKAGLWEVKPVSQIVDGQDMSQRMAAAQAQMQKALENMTPEQRKQMASMMGRGAMPGAGGAGIAALGAALSAMAAGGIAGRLIIRTPRSTPSSTITVINTRATM